MSRIILNIINSVLTPELDQCIFYHSNHKQDIDIARTLDIKCLVFEDNKADSNKIFHKIVDQSLSNDLSVRPKFIINSDIFKYDNAKNLSGILRIPIFNIFYEIQSSLRKEAVFQVSPQLNKDINIVLNPELIKKLYLDNFYLIKDYSEIANIIKLSMSNGSKFNI